MTDHDGLRLTLDAHQLQKRTFLLGNEGGFVLHLPVEINARDRTLMPSKWFGASAFGRMYLSGLRVWVIVDGVRTALDRECQTGFTQELHAAVRTFSISGMEVRQTFFVPNRIEAAVMSLESDSELQVVVEPQFDMRYYQSFNTDVTQYNVAVEPGHAGETLLIENHIAGPSETVPRLDFFACLRVASADPRITLLPEKDRLRRKTYLRDEHRERLIYAAYGETHEQSPDEAPIWSQYATTVYAPACLQSAAPFELVFGFGVTRKEAKAAAKEVCESLPSLRQRKQAEEQERLTSSHFATGIADIDQAYAQVNARLNTALVAREAKIGLGEGRSKKPINAIFAGNKYFLDPWKRDENISLGALLVTGDYATSRAILDDTWSHQDERTGRLPQIIRLGEPIVYYSSDGTLWALRRLYQYTRMSGDTTLLDEKYSMVERFFATSLDFMQRGLLPSGGIIDKEYLWETWEDTAYTPRDGYPVEIELLWLTALRNYLPTIEERNPHLAERLHAALEEGLRTFELFYLDGYLADSLTYQWEPRTLLTPNGYMAFDLDVSIPIDIARQMVLLGREQLAGQVGIRSLAPRDWPRVLSPEFMADPKNFHNGHMASVGIYNYHRGIEWLWLNQFFVLGELLHGDVQHAYGRYVHGLVHETLRQSGIGGLSELYDMRGPLGADFQAWSMAGFVAALHAFAGVEVDAINRCVSICPRLPSHWSRVECRRRVGGTRFDALITNGSAGAYSIDVRLVDPIPPDFVVHFGFHSPPDSASRQSTVNGQPVEMTVNTDSRADGMTSWLTMPWNGDIETKFVTNRL